MQLAEQYATLDELSNPVNIGLDIDHFSASSEIGPEGGVVRVTDTESPIFGTSLRIPPGALDTPVRISIITGNHACSFGLSPSIILLPSGLRFKRFATLNVCLNTPCMTALDDSGAVEPAFFHYDETTDQWAHDDTVGLNWHGGTVLCNLLHL